MAEAITYADLRFVKAPLKKGIARRLGQGKDAQASPRLRIPIFLHDSPHRPHSDPHLAPFSLLSRPRG